MQLVDKDSFVNTLKQFLLENPSLVKIEKTRLDNGKIIVSCRDSDTVNWFKSNTPKLLDGKYKAWERHEQPSKFQRKAYYTFLKGPMPKKDVFLKHLDAFNKD